MNTMKAYHEKQALKDLMVSEAIKHREADELVQGSYGDEANGKFKGCAVGCTIRSIRLKVSPNRKLEYNDHGAYETMLGIPRVLALLEDGIFERLPTELAMTWPERFLQAPVVGADLSGVGDKFLHWLLVDLTDGVIKLAIMERTKSVIYAVGDLYAKKIAGETIAITQWRTLQSAAYAAYADATVDADAYAAAYAYAAVYAYAYTDANVYADTAAYAYADSDANQNVCIRQSEKLLELMAAAK